MQIWERLIADTVQLGGVLIFLKDQAPDDLQQWLEPLRFVCAYDVPVVIRSVHDLELGKFKSRSEDLIFFFDEQVVHIKSLNSILQGQRILLSMREIHGVDFVWAQASLDSWKKTIQGLENYLQSANPLLASVDAETPCLFLDRDDVVIRNIPYNGDASKVELTLGSAKMINEAHKRGYWVALVTNQSGLGRGRISWSEYKQVHQRMLELLAEQNSWLDECVWASYIENEVSPEGRLFASLRKPRAGMFQMVQEKLRVKMSRSLMVGDSATDLMAAHAAGVGSLYLLRSDKFLKEEASLIAYQKEHADLKFHTLQSLEDLIFP